MARRPSSAKTIETVEQFITALPAARTGGIFTYRGVGDDRYDVEPGIMRSGRERLLLHERDAVRDIVSVHPQQFSHDQTMFDRLVRMQHFGLPTRMLDVTANPLVALYFATDPDHAAVDGEVSCIFVPDKRKKYYDSDTVSCIANLANLSEAEKVEIYDSRGLSIAAFNKIDAVQRLLQFIRVEKPYFRDEIKASELDRLWFVLPKLSNQRIIAQQGAFLIFGLQPLDRSGAPAIHFDDLKVPADSKSNIRLQLNVLGINESALFPEIEKAARYITRRYA